MPTKYSSHTGCFYSDIGDGTEDKIDTAIIIPSCIDAGVVILKYKKEIGVFDFKDLMENNKKAKVLLSRVCVDPNEAYEKMLKLIGKMVKKGISADKMHISRYFTNTANKDYAKPRFLCNANLMDDVYRILEEVNVFYFT